MPQSAAVHATAGSKVDALDLDGIWNPSVVTKTRLDAVRVRYEGWGKKWDEWIQRDGARLAPVHKHTAYVRCLALRGKEWWPAKLLLRTAATPAGAASLRQESRVYVIFYDRRSTIRRQRAWLPLTDVRPFVELDPADTRLASSVASAARSRRRNKLAAAGPSAAQGPDRGNVQLAEAFELAARDRAPVADIDFAEGVQLRDEASVLECARAQREGHAPVPAAAPSQSSRPNAAAAAQPASQNPPPRPAAAAPSLASDPARTLPRNPDRERKRPRPSSPSRQANSAPASAQTPPQPSAASAAATSESTLTMHAAPGFDATALREAWLSGWLRSPLFGGRHSDSMAATAGAATARVDGTPPLPVALAVGGSDVLPSQTPSAASASTPLRATGSNAPTAPSPALSEILARARSKMRNHAPPDYGFFSFVAADVVAQETGEGGDASPLATGQAARTAQASARLHDAQVAMSAAASLLRLGGRGGEEPHAASPAPAPHAAVEREAGELLALGVWMWAAGRCTTLARVGARRRRTAHPPGPQGQGSPQQQQQQQQPPPKRRRATPGKPHPGDPSLGHAEEGGSDGSREGSAGTPSAAPHSATPHSAGRSDGGGGGGGGAWKASQLAQASEGGGITPFRVYRNPPSRFRGHSKWYAQSAADGVAARLVGCTPVYRDKAPATPSGEGLSAPWLLFAALCTLHVAQAGQEAAAAVRRGDAARRSLLHVLRRLYEQLATGNRPRPAAWHYPFWRVLAAGIEAGGVDGVALTTEAAPALAPLGEARPADATEPAADLARVASGLAVQLPVETVEAMGPAAESVPAPAPAPVPAPAPSLSVKCTDVPVVLEAPCDARAWPVTGSALLRSAIARVPQVWS